MDVVLLAVIGLVVLLGLVAIAVGNKGWSWGTVAAAVLLLFAATGYLYLAARLAERERSWRSVVAKTQSDIDRILADAKPGAAAAPKSLAGLRHQRDRWMRALAFVDTWHGRSWKNATFSPPRDGKAGAITIEMASEESEVAPLSAGAEVAVFDDASIEDEGRFLGLFRVQAVNAVKGAETAQLTIVPAATPAPPSESDTKLWTRNYDAVTVYESLPVDRWLAFHKTPGDDGDAAPDATGRWMPRPRKTAGEEALKSLEEQMTSLEQHDNEIPEEQWPEIDQQLEAGVILPGRYWAVVEFTKNVRFTKKQGEPGAGTFAIDDAAEAAPGGEDDEGDEGPDEPGAMIEPGAPIGGDDAGGDGDAKRPADPDPTAGAVTKRFKEKRFKEGEQAEFDLQTALDLQNDEQLARITRVIERRPLADPFTALRGAEFGAKAADGKPLRAEGIDAVRQGLLVEMESITGALARIKRSRDNVETQAAAVAEETTQLTEDLTSWGKDAAAATATAQAFDDRLRAATIELASLESSIIRLGNALRGDWAALTEAIDAATR
jgi:hypothetical protein